MSVNWPRAVPESSCDESIEADISRTLARMTLADKIGQMIQADIRYISPAEVARYRIGSVLSGGGAHPGGDLHAPVAGWVELADAFYDASLAAGHAVPPLWGIDAVHGHNNVFGATQFPHNVGLGAARNPGLVREIAAATAVEVAATALDWTFAPTIAVVRDVRWGRTYESYSGSVDLVTDYAGEAVSGLQGTPGDPDFLRNGHIIATAKHYMGDGGTAGGVDQGDTLCDETTLRDIHGRPYIEAVRAGAQTVMVSFSSWHGEKLHGHAYLVQQVLKDQLGFDGFVVGDWNGHGQLSASSNVRGHEAINAGVDMLMAPEDWRELLGNTTSQVENGVISIARIDDAVTRILRVKFRAGLRFPNRPSGRRYAGDASVVGSKAHRALARRAVRESAVLLKNNRNALPLSPGARILVDGPGADNVPMQCGGWSMTWQGDDVDNTDFPGATSIFEAIRSAARASGGDALLGADPAQGVFDAAVFVFGEPPYAEGQGDRQHLSHHASRPHDVARLQAIRACGIPVIAVFLTGRPLWVNPELNASDAFVVAWLPGSEGGGLADLLFATDSIDFKGALPFFWPATPHHTTEDDTTPPLFPLGYGLSYRQGSIVSDELDAHDDAVMATPADRLGLFDRGPVEPFRLCVGDEVDWRLAVRGSRFFSAREVVEVRVTDWLRQEDARRVRWSGGSGQVFLWSENSMDLSGLYARDARLNITLCLHAPPEGQVLLRQDSIYPSGGELDVTDRLKSLTVEDWQTLTIDVQHFVTAGLDVERVTTPLLIWTDGELELTIGAVSIETTHKEDGG